MNGTESAGEAEALPVLSLWQPHATLVALNIKTVETRNRQAPKTVKGKRIAIHATKRKPTEDQRVGDWTVHEMAGGSWRMYLNDDEARSSADDSEALPLGCIVATARLVASVPMVAGDDVANDVDHCRTGKNGFIWVGRPHLAGRCYDSRLERYQWNGTQYELLLTEDTEGQRPYGDFAQGRWAWILSDLEPIDPPVPFVGGQGFSRRWVRP